MNGVLLIVITALLASAVLLLLLLYVRASRAKVDAIGGDPSMASLRESLERTERLLREEMARNRNEVAAGVRQMSDSLQSRMTEIALLQKGQLDSFAAQIASLSHANEDRLDAMRQTMENRLKTLQDENALRLEQMRVVVDEKLHATLEQRLGESFRLVSDRLEMVQRGLGEMQTLAAGVGDLKKVLTNVKTRGTWGEIQLGNLLEQILTKDQYAVNIATRANSADRVEYAVKLPGRDETDGGIVWLPIDAKFPQEDYQKLQEAQEHADAAGVEEASRALEARIKMEAKSIREKYIDPPQTTDFGIMFLPTEGLYAEVLRRPGLCEYLQRDCRILVTGPTTLAALLNSLQMGFRTLAIERRSSEVWALLGAVKTEFSRFGDVLEKTQRKLQEASSSIEAAATRTRVIERKLRDVQQLPAESGNGDGAQPTTSPELPPVPDAFLQKLNPSDHVSPSSTN